MNVQYIFIFTFKTYKHYCVGNYLAALVACKYTDKQAIQGNAEQKGY